MFVGVIGLSSTVIASQLESSRFVPAQSGYEYVFPRDHASHDHYQTEWWYFTGHLRTTSGRRFGYELTFFRRGIDEPHVWDNPSVWAIRHLYLAHLALTDEQASQFRFAEKVSRAGVGKAGARETQLDVWIDRWSVKAVNPNHEKFHLLASTPTFSIDLIVEPRKPPIIHGKEGVSMKGQQPEETSHYYSLTRLQTTGTLLVDGQLMNVAGISWMDHEFGSSDLAEGLVGWDWFSLQLNNHHEIMVYGLRRSDGTFDPASSGTLVFPDGSGEYLSFGDVEISILDHWRSSESGAEYPSRWKLHLPSKNVMLSLSPRMLNQELITKHSTDVTYWEGAIDVAGKWNGQPIKGQGYVEMTGYAKPYRVTGAR